MRTAIWTFSGSGIALVLFCVASISIHAGTIDAVSGGSINIAGGTTTDSSATITWQEYYSPALGTETLYLDSLSDTSEATMKYSVKITKVKSASDGITYTWTIPRKLAPNTTYFYVIDHIDVGGENLISGSFLTDPKGSAAVLVRTIPSGFGKLEFDILGQRLSRARAGTAIGFGKVGGARFDPAK